MRNLAATYRPARLDDVVGQEQAKRVLRAHMQSKPKSGYCFVGSAGTGKTTCARIFAYELNKGKTNVVEINAADANGIDTVRQIIEDAKKKPIGTPYRIFILDECHMFSNAAWNALLKLIEEPPATVVILMCTTDPRKIPATITSRVLRLDFSRIDVEQVTERLCWVMEQEKYTDYDREALRYVAQLSNGGMRDALSMLDKVVSYEAGITLDVVNQALGLIGFSDSFELLDALYDKSVEDVVRIMTKLNSQGSDFRISIQDFRRFLLNGVKYNLNVPPELIPMPANELQKFQAYPKDHRMMWLLARVNDVVPKTTYDTDPYTLVTTEFIRMAGEL